MNHRPRTFHMYLKLFRKGDCRWHLVTRRLLTFLWYRKQYGTEVHHDR